MRGGQIKAGEATLGSTTIDGDLLITGNTTITGTTFGHPPVSTTAAYTPANSGGKIIQNLEFDAYGHVLTASSYDFDARYLTLDGGTLTKSLTLGSGVANTAQIILDISKEGSPQISFNDTGGGGSDMYWAVGTDDSDNSFKIHGSGTSPSPTINGLVTPFFEITTGGALYAGTSLIWHAGNDGSSSGLDADLLDGQHGSFYHSYNPTITLTAGSGLSGGSTFTLNQSSAKSITFSHADTSSQGSVNNSLGFVIQDITLDTFGHITSLASTDLDGRFMKLFAGTIQATQNISGVTGSGIWRLLSPVDGPSDSSFTALGAFQSTGNYG